MTAPADFRLVPSTLNRPAIRFYDCKCAFGGGLWDTCAGHVILKGQRIPAPVPFSPEPPLAPIVVLSPPRRTGTPKEVAMRVA